MVCQDSLYGFCEIINTPKEIWFGIYTVLIIGILITIKLIIKNLMKWKWKKN